MKRTQTMQMYVFDSRAGGMVLVNVRATLTPVGDHGAIDIEAWNSATGESVYLNAEESALALRGL